MHTESIGVPENCYWMFGTAYFDKALLECNKLMDLETMLQPTVDIMADAENSQCLHHIGEEDDVYSRQFDKEAFGKKWNAPNDECAVFWVNPPFDHNIGGILRLMRRRKACGFCCVPEWKSKEWWNLIKYYAKAHAIFEPLDDLYCPKSNGYTDGVGRTDWRTVVVLLDFRSSRFQVTRSKSTSSFFIAESLYRRKHKQHKKRHAIKNKIREAL